MSIRQRNGWNNIQKVLDIPTISCYITYMEPKPVNITPEEAGIVILALTQFAEKAAELGEQLIENTHMKQAGFNQLDTATTAREIMDRLNAEFPILDDDIHDEGE